MKTKRTVHDPSPANVLRSARSDASDLSAPSRRRFLAVLGGTAAAVGLGAVGFGVGCSSAAGASEASGPIAAGNVSAVPLGYLGFVGDAPVVLGRDSGGLYAMSAICTHESCDMSQGGSASSSGVHCGCHGARFSVTGEVISGPAKSALRHYPVELAADGNITVHAGTTASASARTVVPG